MIRHLVIVSLVCAFGFQAAGCKTFTSLASGAISFAGGVAGPQPKQATTIADADRSATLLTGLTRAYVDAVPMSRAQLIQISADSDAVHAALDELKKENAEGKSLSFAAFNAAIKGWNAYTATLPKH